MDSYTVSADPLSHLLAILLCLVISAFFSFCETAVTSLGVLKARHLLNTSKKHSPYLKIWLTHPGRILTTLLIFNNVVNILASAIATEFAYRYTQSGAIGISTGIITILILVFGEILPKSFAKAYSEKVALPCLQAACFMYYASYPAVRFFSDFAEYIIKLFSGGKKSEPLITQEELEFMMKESKKAGVFGDIKKNIIEGAFDFDETVVGEIMTPRMDITAFETKAPFREMIDSVMKTGYSRIPVYRHQMDNIVGMVLLKDLLRYLQDPSEAEKISAKSIMRESIFVPESKTIMEVFKDLQRTKSHLAIVIDEYGGTAGLVTMEDILEEIVGEIQDEFDSEQAKIAKVDEQVFHADGSTHVEDFLEYFGLEDEKVFHTEEYEQGDSNTLSGWITRILGQMPRVGQKLKVGPLNMEVLEVKKHRIQLVKVQEEKNVS
ncbi:MAG: HlyC/CorC family transporter [Oligoflexales bacterium]|nr:HlyC/CorC family transporter [Oligoflexales bacterium]